MIERQFARIRVTAAYGRGWVGEHWDPMLELDYMLFRFRNRFVIPRGL